MAVHNRMGVSTHGNIVFRFYLPYEIETGRDYGEPRHNVGQQR